MIKKLFFCFIPIFCFSLEEQPWFGQVYQFHLVNKYSYDFYSHVNGAVVPLESSSHDNFLYFDLEYVPFTFLSIDGDLQFAATPRQSFSFSTFGLQARYQWFDDIVGDFISFYTGANIRFVSSRSLKDVSSFFHGNLEGTVNLGLGKEFDPNDCLRMRLWGYGLIGFANRGSLWLKETLSLEGLYNDRHLGALFLEASNGYGDQHTINIDHFKGYGYPRYHFLDLGVRYGLKLGVYGTVKVEYKHRFLAHLTPENVNTFSLYYVLPFSF